MIQKSHLEQWEANFEAWIAVVLLAIYGSIIFWNIAVRALAGDELMIAATLSKTLGMFTWVAWLGAAHGVRKESHFRFLMARNRLGRRSQLALYVVEWTLWLVVCGAILWYSIEILDYRMGSGATTRGFPIPTYLFYLAIPVGFSLMLLRVLQQAISKVRAYREGEIIAPDGAI